MRILLCAPESPFDEPSGLGLLLKQLWCRLSERHDVRFVGCARTSSGSDARAQLVPFPRHDPIHEVIGAVRAVATRQPTRARELTRALEPQLSETIARFRPDVVHVLSTSLAGLAARIDRVPIVMSALDAPHVNIAARAAVSSPARRAHLVDEARRSRRFQAQHFPRFERVVVVSDEDAEEVARVAPGTRVQVITYGVDVPGAVVRSPDAATLLFHGVLRFAPNVLAAEHLAREVLPLVRARRPEARLLLVGRDPDARVLALGGIDGVEMVGPVDQLAPWFARATAYACAMTHGTGIKNKLLEAMAHAVPAVVTPLALQGIAVVPDRDVLVAQGPEQLAAAVLDLIDDPDRARTLGAHGREHVLVHHTWERTVGEYETLYEVLAAREVGP